MADSPADAWYVSFITGDTYAAAVDGPQHVRCVRTARAAAPARGYTVTGETVYDPRTKLTWQRSAPTTMYGSDDARTTCASADLAAALGGRRLASSHGEGAGDAGRLQCPAPRPDHRRRRIPGHTRALSSGPRLAAGPLPGPGFVHFANGHATNYADGPTSYVRCVR